MLLNTESSGKYPEEDKHTAVLPLIEPLDKLLKMKQKQWC